MHVKIIDRNLYDKAFLLSHVKEIFPLSNFKPSDERKSNNYNKGTVRYVGNLANEKYVF